MRGKQPKRHKILPDEVYNSELVSKLINYVMHDGKKGVAQSVVYDALKDLGEKSKVSPIEALQKAIENVQPKIEIRSRRVGGSNYQVPTPVNGSRQVQLALRWIIGAARDNKGAMEFSASLSRELLASYSGEGHAMRKKEDVHRMAEANKAFAQFSW